jgi:hypothetical protein
MKIYIVFPGSHWNSERNKPIKCFFNREDADKFVEFGLHMYSMFDNNRHKCQSLESLTSKIWHDNRLVKSKERKYWQFKFDKLRDIFYQEEKEKLSQEELYYHYQHCKDNNLVHIRCYDGYDIVEAEVE